MPTNLKIWALALAISGALGFAVEGQQPYETPSLGAIARQLKEERSKEKQKSVPFFSNDNLSAHPRPQTEPEKATAPPIVEAPIPPDSAPAAAPAEEGENYFHSRAEAIRSRLELHERQLAVLEQQWGLTSTEYYPNPQKTLEEESTPIFHSDTNKLRAKIEEAKKQIAEDREALDNLREELRRKGGDPGWIRQ